MISLLSCLPSAWRPVRNQLSLLIPGTNLILKSAEAGKSSYQVMDYFLMAIFGGWGLLRFVRNKEKSRKLPRAKISAGREKKLDAQMDLLNWGCQQNYGFQPILRFTPKQLDLLFRNDDDLDSMSAYLDSNEEVYNEEYVSPWNEDDEDIEFASFQCAENK